MTEQNQEETYFIIGESRTNVDNAITKIYGSFFIAFEVVPSSGEILRTDCTRALELTNDFIRSIFLHKRLFADQEKIEAEVKRRYHGSSAKALLVAYRDAVKHYQKAVEEAGCDKIEIAQKQVKEGRVVTKSMEELENMANE